ncbi:hypothetical protein BMS3Abin07_01705 [bacterium BMS3Abin07]|nr:hypothetical protein BMS3Abin07_01705 [bacterium BMS3Abin07]GBE33331.1 hypothetical protein BMS3Bbin05_02271 [bacterium BMS3Bbin05]HDO22234.1 hypothetical protein [Nitrospirota bacterium]HDZ87743.1 hypothetical protein [Nitrospirota bacterium]
MKRSISLLLIAVFILSSCSYLNRIAESVDKKLSAIGKDTRKEDEALRRKVERLLGKMDYEGALVLIKRATRDGKPEIFFGDSYVKAIEGISKKGIKYYNSEKYMSAGKTLRRAVSFMPADKKILAEIKYSSEDLELFIEDSSAHLMDRGFKEYRKGNLGYAVSVWKGILEFNPDYKDAIKAIDTATVQMKNLKKID